MEIRKERLKKNEDENYQNFEPNTFLLLEKTL